MMPNYRRPMTRLLRTMVTVLAVSAVIGACSSGDDDASGDSTSTTSNDAEVLVDEPCNVLDQRDLSDVTGLEFDNATPSLNTCVYTSSTGLSAIAVNFRSIGEVTAEQALQAAHASCDEGTVQELELERSDGGFGCLVDGVPTVVATGGGIVAILTGSTLNEDVDPAQILTDLATILANAVEASAE
jgi:hypothetical protein